MSLWGVFSFKILIQKTFGWWNWTQSLIFHVFKVWGLDCCKEGKGVTTRCLQLISPSGPISNSCKCWETLQMLTTQDASVAVCNSLTLCSGLAWFPKRGWLPPSHTQVMLWAFSPFELVNKRLELVIGQWKGKVGLEDRDGEASRAGRRGGEAEINQNCMASQEKPQVARGLLAGE